MNLPSEAELNQLLDKAKVQVFLNNNAAFLGSILCSLDFSWDPNCKTAWTDGLRMGWSPKDFMRCDPQVERPATLVHELWHPALLHQLRRGNRDPRLWNIACDYRINNNMILDGWKLPKNGWWVFDPDIDSNGILSEEEIYELLLKKQLPMPAGGMEPEDLRDAELTQPQAEQIIKAVVRAKQAAEMAGKAGDLPGSLEQMLNTFLNPVVPWEDQLQQWTTARSQDDYSWSRRNRRYPNIYMPSIYSDVGELDSLAYIIDTSGSITDEMEVRFNSEIKYIWETFKPKKLTLVQFDTVIQSVREFVEGDVYEYIKVVGRGGTSLECVREWIEKNRPTAAIVFSDLDCAPMRPLSIPIPVMWAKVPCPSAHTPLFGQVIEIVI